LKQHLDAFAATKPIPELIASRKNSEPDVPHGGRGKTNAKRSSTDFMKRPTKIPHKLSKNFDDK
jgi:hypothetical protein